MVDVNNEGLKILTSLVIREYLKPELILAISSSESGFFNGNTYAGIQGGLGITDGALKYTFLGFDEFNLNGLKEIDLTNEKYLGMKACAAITAHFVDFHIEQYGISKKNAKPEKLKSIKYGNDEFNVAQILFNAIYQYGAGTEKRDYYGAILNGRPDEVAGPSTAIKFSAYAYICEKVGGNCFIPLVGITTGGSVDALKLSSLLSDYTSSQYIFKIE
jgi:hypothetical protein